MATKILVADDRPGTLSTISFALQSEGHEVLTTSDGNEAFKMAQEHRPDVIVLDQVMPKVGGVAVLKALRARAEFLNTPVVILAERTTQADERETVEAGAAFIAKPFSPGKLIDIIEQALQRV